MSPAEADRLVERRLRAATTASTPPRTSPRRCGPTTPGSPRCASPSGCSGCRSCTCCSEHPQRRGDRRADDPARPGGAVLRADPAARPARADRGLRRRGGGAAAVLVLGRARCADPRASRWRTRAAAPAAVALGLVLVLLVSGVIEAFVTPSGLPTWARIGIGVAAEVAFFGLRVRARRGRGRPWRAHRRPSPTAAARGPASRPPVADAGGLRAGRGPSASGSGRSAPPAAGRRRRRRRRRPAWRAGRAVRARSASDLLGGGGVVHRRRRRRVRTPSGRARGRGPRPAPPGAAGRAAGSAGQQAVLDRGRLERGEQHDERAAAGRATTTAAASRRPVGLDEHRLQVGHRLHDLGAGRRRGAPPRTRARTWRSPARKSTRVAGARRRAPRAAARHPSRSRAGGRRRPARPTCARCRAPAAPGGRRSGCQVRTTTLRVRALARQSMLRTSSPRTYSRSESNSVPWPRTRTAARPSSSRSLASRLGRCLREWNGGSTRTVPGTSTERLPAGQAERARCTRTVTRSVRRSPRRVGVSGVVSRTWSPAGRSSRCRLPVAPADGCQASRSSPRTRRSPGLATTQRRSGGLALPDLRRPGGGSSTSRRRVRREQHVQRPPAASTASTHQAAVLAGRAQQHARRTPSSTSSGTRPVSAHRGTGTESTALCSTWLDRDALELGLRAQPQPVGQRRAGQRLHVVGRDEVAALQPGPRAAGAQQRGRPAGADAEAQRRRDPGGPRDVDDVAGDLGGHRHRAYGGRAGLRVARRRPPRAPRRRRCRAGRSRRRAAAGSPARRRGRAAAARP